MLWKLKSTFYIHCFFNYQIVQSQSCLTLQLHRLQHARLPCPPLSPGVCSSSCPLSWWCYLTTSCSTALFSFCLASFPASESFPVSDLFTSGGQIIGASASVSVLPRNSQDWSPLGLTGLISLKSKSLLQYHNLKASVLQCSAFFYGPTLTYVYGYWKNHSFDYKYLCQQSDASAFWYAV